MTNEHARKLGSLGGSRNTSKQQAARRKNAAKARAAATKKHQGK